MVRRLPKRLATIIGEGGMDLSVGQKQQLAFARRPAIPENIQLLCGRHNLQKHDKIE